MQAPAIMQNLGWAVLGVVFFAVGIAIAAVTAGRTMQHFKQAQDSMSMEAWKSLLVGATLAAIFLTPSIYSFIRIGGSALNQMGF
ncbi:hypothetical protein JF729_18295 [Mycobacterium intracellulare]|uniref:hypothetical protein n=1 Tax=Mycobacterium intracellulare TaxID=1767 RepID=UPI001CD97452|nr:hypothetical protein [Mycobacterium intracellulare]MCA2249730.1 hypothetical protein [Mycobacterium intracellulare]